MFFILKSFSNICFFFHFLLSYLCVFSCHLFPQVQSHHKRKPYLAMIIVKCRRRNCKIFSLVCLHEKAFFELQMARRTGYTFFGNTFFTLFGNTIMPRIMPIRVRRLDPPNVICQKIALN
jgi:hypothetical protein